MLRLETGDVLVNRVKLAVATPFYRDLLIVSCSNTMADLKPAFILKIAEIEVEAREVCTRDRSSYRKFSRQGRLLTSIKTCICTNYDYG